MRVIVVSRRRLAFILGLLALTILMIVLYVVSIHRSDDESCIPCKIIGSKESNIAQRKKFISSSADLQ